MTKLRQLIESAKSQKNEMMWKVYSYDPEQDNKLMNTSKAFDCIKMAAAHKRDELEKHPNYIVEIVAESAQKNEAKYKLKGVYYSADGQDKFKIDEIIGNDYKVIYNDGTKATLSEKDIDKWIAGESANIEVKNPGMLEVPDGKNVDDLPMSHFEKLVDKKGYAPIIRALTNLETWNKDKNKSLSKWASNMADKLKKKYRPESAQKNEGKTLDDISTKEAADYIKTLKFSMPLNHPMSINILGTKLKEHFGLSEKPHSIAIKALLENMPKEYLESSQKNEGVHFGQPNVDKCYNELMDISFQEMKKRNGKELSDKEFEAFRPKLLKKYPKEVVDYCYIKANESSQMNETRGYKVIVELGVPDNMNNRDIEDEVERLLRTSHKIDVVMDVTAERK